MRESSFEPFTIIKLVINNRVEVKLSMEFLMKHPVFPVILVKPYHQTEGDKFPKRKESPSLGKVVEEDSPSPVKRRLGASKIKINGKDHIQYLVRFKK
ncbi:hypothetical protein O181_069796 [Austropuccinia psidii MF-1]|uniref:Uncharacterized protein n=1 Tax=Austropuccinia psidii MF-1 TaxID=1389203 RepID=A0A9Q3I541_9BASI|nr:hypothetical protein [Austropuccinia psidii MF-1]